jgi:hypothetical protein
LRAVLLQDKAAHGACKGLVSWPRRRKGGTGSVPALLPEGLPEASGLYDPRREHDACGIGLIANIPTRRAIASLPTG